MARDDKVLTNRELTEKLALLEARELKVKDLPIQALRRELAKEPQNPTDLILPGSIGADMLAVPMKDFNYAGTSVGGINVENLGTATSILSLQIKTTGTYLCGFQADTESVTGGYLVMDLNATGGTPQTVINSSAGQRIPDGIWWPYHLYAGDKVEVLVYLAGAVGRYIVQNCYLMYLRIGV